MTPEPVASSLMRRVSAPEASEVRSKMSAWPRSRVAVVPAGAVRMTVQVVASASDEAVAASVVSVPVVSARVVSLPEVAASAVASAALEVEASVVMLVAVSAASIPAVASSACAAPGTRKEVAARAIAAKARAAARPGFRYVVGFMEGVL